VVRDHGLLMVRLYVAVDGISVSVFFVSFMIIVSIVLMQVVIAGTLDPYTATRPAKQTLAHAKRDPKISSSRKCSAMPPQKALCALESACGRCASPCVCRI